CALCLVLDTLRQRRAGGSAVRRKNRRTAVARAAAPRRWPPGPPRPRGTPVRPRRERRSDLMAITPRPLRTSSPLPPYRAVLAVDAESYTRNSALHQQVLSTAIPDVLEEAFRRSGLEEVWQARRFPQSAGDGYVVGVEPEHLPFLVHPMLGHLQDALEDDQSRLAAHERELRLRLRVALAVGPLPAGGGTGPEPAGSGRAMNDVHRLLDSAPLRDELRASDRDITYL